MKVIRLQRSGIDTINQCKHEKLETNLRRSRGVSRKFLIFQLVITLENQSWYQTDA